MNKYLRDLFYGKGAFDAQPTKTNTKATLADTVQVLDAEPKMVIKPEPSPEWTARQQQIELVKLIHAEFDDEMKNLLTKHSIMVPTKTEHEASLKRAEALKQLGFASALEVAKLEKFNEENQKIIRENEANLQKVKDLQYFSNKYPMYKFITRESLDRICKKYGLHYATVRYFIGTVPQANLQALLDCNIEKKDIPKLGVRDRDGWRSREIAELQLTFNNEPAFRGRDKGDRAPLIIAATLKDFEFPNYAEVHETSSGQVQFKVNEDPIVMQPVYVGENTYFAIITAWGPEAFDPEVINPRNN